MILSVLPGSARPYKTLKRGLVDIFGVFIVGAIVLWATYSFEFKPLLATAPDVAEKIEYIRAFAYKIPVVGGENLALKMVHMAQNVPIPFPSFFISLVGVTNQVLVKGQPLFFMGVKHITGIKLYYVFLFLIKTPLPVIYLLVLSVAAAILRKKTRLRPPDNICLVLPIILVAVSVSMSKVQGGMRYLIPLYPFLFIWISDSVNIAVMSKNASLAKNTFFSVMVIWYMWGAVQVFPDFLGFYNELIGGPDGKAYRITHDMDWGQDLKALKKYMDKNELDDVSLLYFGSALPESYGIKYARLSGEEQAAPGKKVYAISVRYLGSALWTKDRTPTAKAGCSIFIYDFRDPAK